MRTLTNWFLANNTTEENKHVFAGTLCRKRAGIRPERWNPSYNAVCRSLSALPTTLTEESAMAAAAITGESRMPNTG
jgi:hypothetical protein